MSKLKKFLIKGKATITMTVETLYSIWEGQKSGKNDDEILKDKYS